MSLNNSSGTVMRKIANRFSDKKKPIRVEKPRQFFGDAAAAGAGYAVDTGINYALTGEAPSFPSKIPSPSDFGKALASLGAVPDLIVDFYGPKIEAGLEFAKDVGNAIGEGVETGVSAGIDFTENLIENPEKVGNDALAIGENIGEGLIDFGKDTGIVDFGKDVGEGLIDFGEDALEVGEGALNWLGITEPELTEEEKELIVVAAGKAKTTISNLQELGGSLGGLGSLGAASTTTGEKKETLVETEIGALGASLGASLGAASTTTGALGDLFGSLNTTTTNTTTATTNTTNTTPPSKKGDELDGDASPKGLIPFGDEFKADELYNGGEVLEYDPTKESKPPAFGFVDDNKEKTPEELGLKPVGNWTASDDLMKDIEEGTVKEFNNEDNKPPSFGKYSYTNSTKEKVKETNTNVDAVFKNTGTKVKLETKDLLFNVANLLFETNSSNETNVSVIDSNTDAAAVAEIKAATNTVALKNIAAILFNQNDETTEIQKKQETQTSRIDVLETKITKLLAPTLEAEALAKAEADALAKAEADALAKAEDDALAKALAEADALAKAEAEALAKAEAEALAKAEAEALAKALAEEKAKADAIVKDNWNDLSESTKKSAVFSTAAQYGNEGITSILSVISSDAINTDSITSIAKSISDASNKSFDEVYKLLTETISNESA